MSLKIHEVRLARIQLRKSTDERPCVIVEEPRGDRVKVFPVSSTLYDPCKHFLISTTSPDFAATGLVKESYVLDVHAHL